MAKKKIKPETSTEPTTESTTESTTEKKEADHINLHIAPHKHNIFDVDPNPSYSKTVDYPAIHLGFQHYIHQSYSKNEVFNQFEGRKKVYMIINDLEVIIDEYDSSIETVVEKKYKTKIVSKAFYKLIEMANLHGFLDKKSPMTTLHINDKNGGFAQAVLLYRADPKDKLNACSTSGKNIIDKTIKLNYHTKPPTDIGADLVTAYGELEWKSGYTAESEAYGIILDQIQMAIQNQKEGGTFVLKIFETFANVSCRLIELLANLYETVYLVKPMTSRTYSAEKFVVCLKFKPNKKFIDKILSIKTGTGLVNIFPDHPLGISEIMTKANILLSNRQFVCINKMFSYIKSQNFFGDEYHENRNRQIENTKRWLKDNKL